MVGAPFFKILAFPRDIRLDYAAVVNQSLAVAELEQALAIEGSNVIFRKVPALGTFPTPAKPPFQTAKPPT